MLFRSKKTVNATTHYLKHFEELEDPDYASVLLAKTVPETTSAEPQFNSLFEVE